MKISCSVHGESHRFEVVEWDETDDGTVVYRVTNPVQTAFFESVRVEGVDALAEVGVSALFCDGISNVMEVK